ncbi:13607_t:CDS:2 [Ambispora gerdemannii]|uniref:13607_t:CDS:1 n=1 Tax=Ambispora gerdemannii TaxID=144530 RepID=A0A9N8WQS6_9GLOM|nr:13607_t:CDS:2 [Ambispora gerdemannii]
MYLAESSTIFDFSLSQYTPINTRQLDFYLNGLMPLITASSLTQGPITIPEDLSIISLDQLDVSQTNNPLNCAEHDYLFVETNSKEIIDDCINITQIDEFVFADSKEPFESNVKDNNTTNNLIPSPINPFTINTTTNNLTTTTNPSIVPNTSLISSPPPQSPFIPEYLNCDSTFLAGDLS